MSWHVCAESTSPPGLILPFISKSADLDIKGRISPGDEVVTEFHMTHTYDVILFLSVLWSPPKISTTITVIDLKLGAVVHDVK